MSNLFLSYHFTHNEAEIDYHARYHFSHLLLFRKYVDNIVGAAAQDFIGQVFYKFYQNK